MASQFPENNKYAKYYHNYISKLMQKQGEHMSIQEYDRLYNIYHKFLTECPKISDDQLLEFINAWNRDIAEKEDRGLGPEFVMALAYYTNTADLPDDDLYGSWFQEAAARDYILTCDRLNDEVNALKRNALALKRK